MSVLYDRIKIIPFIFCLSQFCLFNLNLSAQPANTSEIQTLPFMQDIDKYLDKEFEEYKKDTTAEDLLKRARELQNLLDYAIKKKIMNYLTE